MQVWIRKSASPISFTLPRDPQRNGMAWEGALGLPMVAFLCLPLLALVIHAPSAVWVSLRSTETRDAIEVSLRSTAASLAVSILVGTPLGLLLGRKWFRGRWLLEAIVEVPLVLPPAAAGIGLLLALGQNGLVRTHLPFSFGAVVVAQAFVSAPLYVRSLAAAVAASDPHWIDAASLDGAGLAQLNWNVRLPIARDGLVAGAVLCWARSLGEFGATILFAGNLSGKTQTMPLAIYLGLESDLDQAIGLSVVLLLVAFVVLVAVRLLQRRS